MMNWIILKDRAAILPYGLAEHIVQEEERAEVYQRSLLRPVSCVLDADGSPEMIPSIVSMIASDFYFAKISRSEDREPWLYLELDGSLSDLISARSKVRCAATYAETFRGIVGLWLNVRDSFSLDDWKETLEFLRELSMTATLFIFIRAMNRPVIRKEFIPQLSNCILGLKVLGASRYSTRQLALIAMEYIKALKIDIAHEEIFLLELTTRMARMNTSCARNALLLADYFARHAVIEDDRPVVYPEVIATSLAE